MKSKDCYLILLFNTVGPFIREKIRRELYRLYDRVLHKTRKSRINDPRLILQSWKRSVARVVTRHSLLRVRICSPRLI